MCIEIMKNQAGYTIKTYRFYFFHKTLQETMDHVAELIKVRMFTDSAIIPFLINKDVLEESSGK